MMNYKDSGVDIGAGNLFTAMIKERVGRAWPDVQEQIGGFAGGALIPSDTTRLISSTDGTGTKAKIAAYMDMFDWIGQDAVAMAVVDSYVDGALPYYVLDYLSVGKLDTEKHIAIIDSVIEACKMIGARLIGGETAEHPGTFRYDWLFDLAAFSIGFPVDNLITKNVRVGQKIIGWPSGCPGSNGFSLLRKVFNLNDSPSKVRRRLSKRYPEFSGDTLAEVLLQPTPMWIQDIEEERKRGVKFAAHAHITGGGLVDNPVRIMPNDCVAVIDRSAWKRPAIFSLTQGLGSVPPDDMDQTFNNGIMMISVIEDGVTTEHPAVVEIGIVEKRNGDGPQVILEGQYQD